MPEPVTEMLSRHSPEPDEAIAARITAARQRKQASGLTAEARILLERAGSRFGLTSGQLAQIIAVATTIATLDSAPYVGAQHVAEAVQYRRGRNYYAQ
jgi:predicted ATPase with chaperone activity